jgi:predicted acyl esterase
MKIERDTPITMDDGIVLRADVFRPETDERVPVIMTLGPYGKGVRYQEGYKPEWDWLIEHHPELRDGSSLSNMVWETVDPECWVPDGYAVIRVDSRGAGRSEGILDCFSARETQDFHDSIEWAASQPWCNGKVGLCGVSYYGISQWLVAATQPPHLRAIIPWDGANDHYREQSRHGGILCTFFKMLWPMRILRMQHGKGTNGLFDPWQGEPAAGPETLSDDELAANRADVPGRMKSHILDDQFHRERSADLSKVTVPLLSAANWGGWGLHPRGNFEGFMRSASPQKWLEVHGGRHEELFVLPEARALQKRFLDHFLKDVENGWEQEPPVLLNIRHPGERFVLRKENEWPLARTAWTRLYFDGANDSLRWDEPLGDSSFVFDGFGEGVTALSDPIRETMEITGPLAAKLFLSSSTIDADVFVTLRAFGPSGDEIWFQGTLDPTTPLAQGCLRASQRRVDVSRSEPFQPYHTHDVIEPLVPGEVYDLDVEIWPTSIVLPAGSRLAVTIAGRDFARGAKGPDDLANKGSGPFLHIDPDDRPPTIFNGETTLHTGGSRSSHLLLPIIPNDTTSSST